MSYTYYFRDLPNPCKPPRSGVHRGTRLAYSRVGLPPPVQRLRLRCHAVPALPGGFGDVPSCAEAGERAGRREKGVNSYDAR